MYTPVREGSFGGTAPFITHADIKNLQQQIAIDDRSKKINSLIDIAFEDKKQNVADRKSAAEAKIFRTEYLVIASVFTVVGTPITSGIAFAVFHAAIPVFLILGLVLAGSIGIAAAMKYSKNAKKEIANCGDESKQLTSLKGNEECRKYLLNYFMQIKDDIIQNEINDRFNSVLNGYFNTKQT